MTEGLEYVVDRIGWYMALCRLLLKENIPGEEGKRFREEMENKILSLYKGLLEFQMKCTCRCYDNWAIVRLLKDMSGFTNWNEKLETVKKLEEETKSDTRDYRGQISTNLLHDLANYQKDVISELQKSNKRADRREAAEERKLTNEDKRRQAKLTGRFFKPY
jgi:hypothetical protein